MKYLSTCFRFSGSDAGIDNETLGDILAAALGECGYEAFESSDNSLTAYIQEQQYNEDVVLQVVGEFPIEGVAITFTTEQMPDKDWNKAWEDAGFDPIVVDDKLVVMPASMSGTAAKASFDLGKDEVNLFIEARQAFGTGTHETTQMVLKALLDINPAGKSVLDCGCGTGILSIAALKFGAHRAVAYDIDEWSTANARHNAIINGTEQIEIYLGDVSCLERMEGEFDIILANINRNIIIADLPQINAKARKSQTQNTELVLSGFLEDDVPMLLEAAKKQGFVLHKEYENGEWRCLWLSKQ